MFSLPCEINMSRYVSRPRTLKVGFSLAAEKLSRLLIDCQPNGVRKLPTTPSASKSEASTLAGHISS